MSATVSTLRPAVNAAVTSATALVNLIYALGDVSYALGQDARVLHDRYLVPFCLWVVALVQTTNTPVVIATAECEASALALVASEFAPVAAPIDLWDLLQVDAVIDAVATVVAPTPVLMPAACAGYLMPAVDAPVVATVDAPAKSKTRRGGGRRKKAA